MAERKPIVYVSGNPQEIADTDRVKNTGVAYQASQPSNPQDGDAWVSSGSGNLYQVYSGGAWNALSYLTQVEVSSDITPQLGGPLDVNNQSIISANNGDIVLDPHGTGSIVVGAPFKTTSNGDIDLDPNGSGDVVIKGNSTRGAGAIQLNCEFNSHGIKLKSPPHSANASYTLTFPNDAGTNGYALTTNGSGTLSWTEQVPDGSITSAKLDTNITISGNLTVNGTTTTVNSTTLSVDDKNIELGSVSTPSDTTADGGGITLKGASDKTITWVNSTNCWTFNQSVNLTAGTASAPALILNGDVNTGFFQSATDEIAVGTAGSERLRVGSAGQIGIAGANYGTAGQVLTSGGGSGAPTWSTPAANPSVSLTASGAISDGDPICINTNGTVSAITGASATFAMGADAYWTNNHNCDYMDATFDSTNNKVVIVYEDTSNSLAKSVVATIASNGSVSYGTPVTFYSGSVDFASVSFDPGNGKVVVCYRRGSTGYAKVGTVSGTSITWGSEATFASANPPRAQISYDQDNQKMVIFYYDYANSAIGGVVGTVASSGNSITFGSNYSTSGTNVQPAYLTTAYSTAADKFVISFQDQNNSQNYSKTVVATVSGTAISFGSFQTIVSETTQYNVIAYDAAVDRFVLALRNDSNSNRGQLRVGTLSGTTLSFSGFSLIDGSNAVDEIVLVPEAHSGTIVVAWRRNSGGSYRALTAVTQTWGGFTTGSINAVETASAQYPYGVYDSNVDKVFLGFRKQANFYGGGRSWTSAYSTTNLTSKNFLGFANGAAADGATASIHITGAVNGAQSGLTIGETYHVQDDGSLGTSAGNYTAVAGLAIAADKIVVRH